MHPFDIRLYKLVKRRFQEENQALRDQVADGVQESEYRWFLGKLEGWRDAIAIFDEIAANLDGEDLPHGLS